MFSINGRIPGPLCRYAEQKHRKQLRQEALKEDNTHEMNSSRKNDLGQGLITMIAQDLEALYQIESSSRTLKPCTSSTPVPMGKLSETGCFKACIREDHLSGKVQCCNAASLSITLDLWTSANS